jgi:LmbE family N-acetylglucosaminyl deacetylase
MLPLRFDGPADRPLRLLCLGAHADDLEIGCGGTVLTLTASRRVDVTWVVFSGEGARQEEARRGAAAFLAGAHASRVFLETFRDGYFPAEWAAIKDRCEALRRESEPDLILTHHRHDRHQDHRVLAELAWNTWRNHTILEYEIPKYDGDLGHPTLHVPLSRETAGRKVEAILETFASQQGRHWFDAETFRGLLRIRGIECAAPEGYAEAFYAPKLTLGV